MLLARARATTQYICTYDNSVNSEVTYENVISNPSVSADRVTVTGIDSPDSDIVVIQGIEYPLENSPTEHDLQGPVIVEETSLDIQPQVFEETADYDKTARDDCLVVENTYRDLLEVWPDDRRSTEIVPEPNCSDEIPNFSEIIPEPNCSDEITNFTEIIPEPNCSDEITNFTEIIPEPNCSDEITNFTEIIPEPNCSDEITNFTEIIPEPNCSDEIPKFSEIVPEPNCSDEIPKFSEILPEPNCSDELTHFTDIIPEPICSEETPNSIIPEPNCSDELPSSQQVSAPACCDKITNSLPILEPDRFHENIYSPHKQGQSYMHIYTDSQELPASPDADEITDAITASPQEVSHVTGMHAPMGTPRQDITTWYQQMLSDCRHESIWMSSTTDESSTNVDFPVHHGDNTNNIFSSHSSWKHNQDHRMHNPDQVMHTFYPSSLSSPQDLDTVDKGVVSDTNLTERSLATEPPLCFSVSLPEISDLPGFATLNQELQTMLPTTSTSDTPVSTTMCSTCCKPVSR